MTTKDQNATVKLQEIYLPWIAIAKQEDMEPWTITLPSGDLYRLSCPCKCAVEIEEAGFPIVANFI